MTRLALEEFSVAGLADKFSITHRNLAAPRPSVNALLMTLEFAPGGMDPMTNGFGNSSPFTLVANVGITCFLVNPVSSLTGFRKDCLNKLTPDAMKEQIIAMNL
jgi:hypothetical protein